MADPGAHGQRAGHDPRPPWRPQAAATHDRRDRRRGRIVEAGAAGVPNRYARRTRILQEWRHSAVRAAAPRGVIPATVVHGNGFASRIFHWGEPGNPGPHLEVRGASNPRDGSRATPDGIAG